MSADENDPKWGELRSKHADRREEIKSSGVFARVDWDLLGRHRDQREAALQARRGARTRDWDQDFYAAVIGLNIKLFRPLVVLGKIVNYLVALVFLVAIVWVVSMLVEHQVAPVKFLDVKVMTPDVPQGGKLRILFDIDRRKVCQIDPDYSIIDSTGRKVNFVAQRQEVGGPLGHDPFSRDFDVPPMTAPGPARFRIGWSWVCTLNFIDLLFPRQAEVRDVPFVVSGVTSKVTP